MQSQETQQFTLLLSLEETQGLLQVLGDLPTRVGIYPLVMKIKEQAESQLKQPEVVAE